MAANIYGLHVFANDVGPVPLALLDQNYNALVTALNTLSTFSNFYADAGTTNQLTVQTPNTQFATYTDGLQITVRVAATNTGAATLNVNGLGAQPILTSIGGELQPNALIAGSMVTLIYNAQRQAWQIAGGGSGGQITAPLHVTDPGGNTALAINPDGTGYLGDFNGNGLSWDGACHFTFEGGATLSGIKAPFAVTTDTSAGLYYDALGGLNLAAGDAGSRSLDIFGAVNADPMVAQIHSGNNTVPGKWILWVGANDDTTSPGCSFGEYIMAGTNANDISFQVVPLTYASVTLPPYEESPNNTFLLRGDRTGAIGPAPNQLVWDTAGNFTLTGTATLPMPPLIDLPGITITNPQNGEALVYDQATNSWVNGAPVNALAALNDVALTAPANGQSLTYNAATQRWVNSPPVLALEGLTNTHISGPVPGQVLTYSVNPTPGWVNATIPGYFFLNTLSVVSPQAGDVLTWDGSGWIGAPPGQVATFPLTALTDVSIQAPLNRQVLTWDAPNAHWINAPAATPSLATLPDVTLTSQTQGQVLAWDATLHRWVNSALPGGSVIALDTLMDTNISDPQNNQVLTWDYASARWVNRVLPPVFTPVLTTPSAGQVLSWNGTNWVNSTIPAQALANLTDVALTTPSDGELLTYHTSTQKWQNNGWAWIQGTTGHDAFTAYGVAGNWAGFFRGAATGGHGLNVQVGTTSADIVFQCRNEAGSWLANITADGAGSLGRLEWEANGAYVLPAPLDPSFTTLTVSGPTNSIALLAQGNPSAAYFAGAVSVYDATRATRFLLLQNDGSGRLGAGAGKEMSWDSNGDFIIGNSSLLLYGAGTVQDALKVLSPFTGPNRYCGNFQVYYPTTPAGYANGVFITAGTNTNDYALRVQAYNVDRFLIRGDGLIGCPNLATTGNAANAYFVGDGFNQLMRGGVSSGRYKRNIKTLRRSLAREDIAKLRPISFRSNTDLCPYDDPKVVRYGLIAEEVAEVDTALVSYREGKPESVNYSELTVLLLLMIQEMLGMDEPEAA